MKTFEEFTAKGTVRKQTPNPERARALVNEAENKKEFLEIAMKNIPVEQVSPNFVVESCYDILLELIRAKMFIDGFNSGNSHEAEVSYARLLGIDEDDVRFMDELRYFRNGIKYYGRSLDKEYADKTLNFLQRIYPLIKAKVRP